MTRLLQPFDRLLAALTDAARRERTMLWLLVGYCAIWSLYGALAKGSQDLHFDMGEMVAWSREAGIGTPKHPPFAAWVVRVWFALFPQADWAFYLLAMVLATFALWVAWRAFEPYVDGEKRVAALALLTFVPFFNFHALKYNANTILVPLWAVTTWLFLRSFETRQASWAWLAGVAAAGAMLGKYWSIFLLAGLGIAALADPRRAAFFRSPAPWLTIAAGAIAFAPHLAWIVASGFAPFAYAVDAHPATLASAASSAVGFLVGVGGYIAAPVVLAALAARPDLAAVRDTLWPETPERRLVLLAFVLPLVLPVIVAIAMKVEIVSLWAIGGMALLGVVLLSSPLVTVPRVRAVHVVAMAVMLPILMTIAAPFIAIYIHREGLTNYATHYRLLANQVDRVWRETTTKPMRFVGSYTNVVNGVVFYLKDRPSTLDIMTPDVTPWADPQSVARDGVALVCPEPETMCVEKLRARAGPDLPRHAVTLSRRHFGHADAPVRYIIVVVPPK